MAYPFQIALMPVGTHAVTEDLTSAAVFAKWAVQKPVILKQVGFVIKTATVSSGNIVITFKKYPTFDSTASASSLGTVTIPTAAAAGKCYYKALTPAALKPGEMLVAEVTTAAAGGGAAGAGTALIMECEESPEYVGNNANLVAG